MNLFENFNFALLDDPDFKEDAVRESLIKPLLNTLGYSASDPDHRIIRSKTLTHPFVKTGSNRKNKIKLIPDYLMEVDETYAWVLDAKAPKQAIIGSDHRDQAYFYAIHPDIRTRYYALCNGSEFILFDVSRKDAVLYFLLTEIDQYWQPLVDLLSPTAFSKTAPHTTIEYESAPFDYSTLKPLREIKPRKQSAKRHYGVHGYFTRQVWNVVQAYVGHFTKPGDVVLDPFGGSGVTAIEALILGREAIHIDINPLSIFIVENLISSVSMMEVSKAYNRVISDFAANKPETNAKIRKALKKYDHPTGIALPKNSDVETVEELFSSKQLAQLAYLKHLIQQVNDKDVRGVLMLMFSGLLNQINLTFHASKNRSPGRGNSAMFAYYRYRIAPEPSMLEILPRFELRYKRVMAAKKEIAPLITSRTLKNAHIYQDSATKLENVLSESVDYIYTDPPYGAKIAYLDLSTMWNAWLELPVTEEDKELEVIEGGELGKSGEDYSELMTLSIQEMYRVLKFDRWMSFVFAHKDPQFWHKIVESAEKAGFEYAGAVTQSNGKKTFKKRQNPFRVIEGQLIINFKKVHNPRGIMRVELGADIADIVEQTVEGIIVKNDGATIEEINDELILRGLELGFLDILSSEYQDISPFVEDNFDYDGQTKKFHIVENSKIKARIDIRLRIRYYLISYLRRMKLQGNHPTTDEIIWKIMPLLKNGVTPENQTILSVLKKIAIPYGDNQWRLVNADLQRPLL